jgi:hypothetical protein
MKSGVASGDKRSLSSRSRSLSSLHQRHANPCLRVLPTPFPVPSPSGSRRPPVGARPRGIWRDRARPQQCRLCQRSAATAGRAAWGEPRPPLSTAGEPCAARVGERGAAGWQPRRAAMGGGWGVAGDLRRGCDHGEATVARREGRRAGRRRRRATGRRPR